MCGTSDCVDIEFSDMITEMYKNSELSAGFGGFGVTLNIPNNDLFADDYEDQACIEVPVIIDEKEQLQWLSLSKTIKVFNLISSRV